MATAHKKHPTLPSDLPAPWTNLTIQSCITTQNGYPQLEINGILQEGLAYITYLTHRNQYHAFSKAGYQLFSLPVFFGFNHLNENSGLDVFSRGIFDDPTPDFSVFDADIQMILQACPQAYILPRVNVSLSRTWELSHPDELCDPHPDGRMGRVCLASDLWMEEVKRELTLFLEHIAQSPYASRVAGYQIAGGNTEEWLPLDTHGISGGRAKEKYQVYLHEKNCTDTPQAFARFYSELVACRVSELAAYVKNLTHHRVVVGSFYGYTFECTDKMSGHHALSVLLDCKDIDFICSPVSYGMNRLAGRDHPYMTPISSIMHHGKMYFSENDTRTHLSRPVNDMPWYNAPIWFGPDKQVTCDIMLMHAAKALIHHHGAWWFDMWGGWFADDDYMEMLSKLRTIFEESISLPMKGLAEVAVFVDEEAYAYVNEPSVSHRVCYLMRENLGVMGTPYDVYLASDAKAVVTNYKAVISLAPTTSFNNQALLELTQEHQIPCLVIHAENADMTPCQLREFLEVAGVHIWSYRNAVIDANQSYVFLHTTEDGNYELHHPHGRALQNVLTGEIYKAPITCRGGQSFLFRCLS